MKTVATPIHGGQGKGADALATGIGAASALGSLGGAFTKTKIPKMNTAEVAEQDPTAMFQAKKGIKKVKRKGRYKMKRGGKC